MYLLSYTATHTAAGQHDVLCESLLDAQSQVACMANMPDLIGLTEWAVYSSNDDVVDYGRIDLPVDPLAATVGVDR